MRWIALLSFTAVLAAAQSHPSWWMLASPEATALVGIRMDNLRQSKFADAVTAELSGGDLGFPDLPLIENAREILISSPGLLAIASGDFTPVTLREQALAKGMKPASYLGVAMWISPGKSTLSVAALNDQLILIGLVRTLKDAIDRSMGDSPPFCPLLERAARFSGSADLWVVAAQLPDPLASLFLPVDAQGRDFEGSLSVADGLRVNASFDSGSEEAAATAADALRRSIPSLPAIAQSLQVTADANHVLIDLEVSAGQLAADVRKPDAPPQPEPKPAPKPAPPKQTGPQVIQIFGLDGGPREIPLPAPKQP